MVAATHDLKHDHFARVQADVQVLEAIVPAKARNLLAKVLDPESLDGPFAVDSAELAECDGANRCVNGSVVAFVPRPSTAVPGQPDVRQVAVQPLHKAFLVHRCNEKTTLG